MQIGIAWRSGGEGEGSGSAAVKKRRRGNREYGRRIAEQNSIAWEAETAEADQIHVHSSMLSLISYFKRYQSITAVESTEDVLAHHTPLGIAEN